MAGHIPPEIIDTIRARIDIVDLIQSYIPLKRAGRDFKACCPFHQEKTPSFVVSQQRQHYHCFGCGKHGSAITFVMERENVDFPTAIRLIARKYNIYIPEEEPHYGSRYRQNAPGEQTGTNQSRRGRLFLLHEKLAAFYREMLMKHPESAVAQYLTTRKLSPESIERFGLGASPDSWDSAMKFSLSQGFTEEELAEGGIIKVSEDRSKRYDLFRNRLMFPIRDELGRVVGFSARTIESDPKSMKYVNTHETPIFKKGRLLYGMDLARSEMAESKFGYALLCEGQLDVIAMHAAGFTNTVAAEGTAFTPEQAAMLKRYTDRIRLGLDSDNAGTNAVWKDARILLPLGFEVKVVRFPGGKDPDELLKNGGHDAVAAAVDAARDFFEFALEKNREINGDSPAGKAHTAEVMSDFIALLKSEAAQSAYTAWVADQLGLNRDALYNQLQYSVRKTEAEEERMARYAESRREREQAQAPQTQRKRPLTPAEKQYQKALLEILQCLLSNRHAAGLASNLIDKELLDESPYSAAVETVIQAAMLDEWDEAPQRVASAVGENPDLDPALSEMLMADFPEISDPEAEKIFYECLRVLQMRHLEFQYHSLLQQLRALPPDAPDRRELMLKISEISCRRAKI